MDVCVSAAEARELERIVREGRGEARLYRRARMVQMGASGASMSSIARALGTNRTRLGEWLRRFDDEGIEGLEDQPRSGRPVEITPLERHQVIAAATSEPVSSASSAACGATRRWPMRWIGCQPTAQWGATMEAYVVGTSEMTGSIQRIPR